MVYADTDFILAIVKESDWLQSNARKILEEEDEIYTSAATFLETIIVLKRSGIKDTAALVEDILGIVNVLEVDEEVLFQMAFYMDEGANPFDAYHAAISGEMPIISSDSVYDELGKERIKLED
jgi:predicted nucleic acid-binding protein